MTHETSKTKSLTVNHDSSSRPIVVDHLNVPEVDVAEEDAVVIRGLLTVVEGQGDDVLEVVRVLERLEGRVEIALV